MMAVKFKIDFQIDAETLFGLISKFLPLENLHVEEVVERHAPAPKLAHQSKFAPKHKRARRHGKGIDIHGGVNGLILRALADGRHHRFKDIQDALSKDGYAQTGLGSKLKRLLEHGAVERVESGVYRKRETP